MYVGKEVGAIGGSGVGDVYIMIMKKHKKLYKYCVTCVRDI